MLKPESETCTNEQHSLPSVSVVMPVRNEARYIGRALNSVLAQDYPANGVEIIVADGMSTDGTREIVQSIKPTDGRVILIDNPGKIAPTALNAAIAAASGQIVVRIDGHCEIAPDYVRKCVEYLTSGIAECVGGPIETIGETSCARAIAAAMSSDFGVGGAAFRTVRDKTMLTDTVAFPAMSRKMLQQAGQFDEELVRNQDDEYSFRLTDLGARILLASDIRSRYYSRGTLKSLWRQYFQYGLYKVRVLQKHPKRARVRHLVPAMFVLGIGVCAVAAAVGLRWPLFCVAVSYVGANLLASLNTARKTDWGLIGYLPVVYGILHLAYGIGFWVGISKYRDRWTPAAA
jgi:succinoglycan biosynthesis protein ExoA